MASRKQHPVDALPGVRVNGWGPHIYYSDVVCAPDVGLSLFRGPSAESGPQVSIDATLTCAQARRLAAALVEASDAAEAFQVTRQDDAPEAVTP